MRFFFHLVNGRQRIADRIGIELTFQTVLSPAVFAVLREIWPGTAEDAWKGWSVEIADAEGTVVRTIALI